VTDLAPTDYPALPTNPVRREVMRMWWRDLLFVHWPYEPAEVQALLPEGVQVDPWVDEHDNEAVWVGLVPFRMHVGIPGGREIPVLGVFPETNVRTYVRGPDGEPGVWFFSLEAGGLAATATARISYGLPYFWADMSISSTSPATGASVPTSDRSADVDSTWTYTSTRRWPGPVGVAHRSVARVGAPIADHEVSPFEHYLTARWGLYSRFPTATAARGINLYAAVDHGRWPLHQAELLELDDSLMTAAGLREPSGDPVVHWTRGTEVRIGRPRLAR
jgi:uncharacterized protein YqjF (DUF2071 family)